jgi:hypothetical protein
MISARGPFRFPFSSDIVDFCSDIRDINGKRYASVFPDPVSANKMALFPYFTGLNAFPQMFRIENYSNFTFA